MQVLLMQLQHTMHNMEQTIQQKKLLNWLIRSINFYSFFSSSDWLICSSGSFFSSSGWLICSSCFCCSNLCLISSSNLRFSSRWFNFVFSSFITFLALRLYIFFFFFILFFFFRGFFVFLILLHSHF